MSFTSDDLLSGTPELASLPEVLYRANKMVRSGHYSAVDIGRVISQDSGLSTRLLKVVNSPFYGFPSSIDTVSRAITIIGSRELCDILCATTVMRTFEGVPIQLIDMQHFWQHSLYCAVAAREIALVLHEDDIEHHFLCGLLHDVGSLVMYHRTPELAAQALRESLEQGTALHLCERRLIGTDHAEVGARLLQRWRLPETLSEAVAFHHDPVLARNYPRETWITHAAEIIAHHALSAGSLNGHTEELEILTRHAHLLDPRQLDDIVARSAVQFSLACKSFF
ncbi:MAG: HDOD domain-containing protein [Gammaproteobacteria bacterium]|nr:HDOD domain-containing protein [Gammaproteobacteria bacterium]